MPDYSEQLKQVRENQETQKTKDKKRKPVLKQSQISDVEFIIVGFLALINDSCDWIGLDLVLFRAVDLLTAGILGLWCLLRLKKFPGARFGVSFLVELIPILGDISPTWSIFILSVYLEQRGYLGKIKFLKKFIK